MQVKCMAHQQQLGRALQGIHAEYQFYPLWDDGGSPIRYTWVDVLAQLGHVPTSVGYCPNDERPDPLNEARARATDRFLLYPPDPTKRGVDYSYGIAVPLSAGGWARRTVSESESRVFEGHERDTSRRILAGDGNWTSIYNLSSDGVVSRVWNDPTQFGNTVAWRHARFAANFLYQDGHVSSATYDPQASKPIDTVEQFVWYPGEPVELTPEHQYNGQHYPDLPPPNIFSSPAGDVFPADLHPRYYTVNRLWTNISHK
jgi:prepilin-type processing-associated H-X9-DG protein